MDVTDCKRTVERAWLEDGWSLEDLSELLELERAVVVARQAEQLRQGGLLLLDNFREGAALQDNRGVMAGVYNLAVQASVRHGEVYTAAMSVVRQLIDYSRVGGRVLAWHRSLHCGRPLDPLKNLFSLLMAVRSTKRHLGDGHLNNGMVWPRWPETPRPAGPTDLELAHFLNTNGFSPPSPPVGMSHVEREQPTCADVLLGVECFQSVPGSQRDGGPAGPGPGEEVPAAQKYGLEAEWGKQAASAAASAAVRGFAAGVEKYGRPGPDEP